MRKGVSSSYTHFPHLKAVFLVRLAVVGREKEVVTDSQRRLKMAFLMVVLVGAFLVYPCQAGMIYVDADADGANDGSSWGNAYNYLQDGLAEANSLGVPAEIWVAASIYTPDSNSADPDGSGDRTATFQLINGVAIYGGFAGGGGIWEDRDPNLYETILSGDLYGNDDIPVGGPGGGVSGENCVEAGPINRGETAYSTVGSTTDGPGDCPTNQDIWYVYTADFTGCLKAALCGSDYSTYLSAYEGATCPPTVLVACNRYSYNECQSEVVFDVTEGSDYLIRVGGDGSATGTGTITITKYVRCDNSYHVVTGSGTDANAVLDGFTITGGNADTQGAGMYNVSGSPTVTNCTFTQNSARWGGGMYNINNSNPTITNCTFSENSARGIHSSSGGGMLSSGPGGGMEPSRPTVTNCRFIGNSARSTGGGMFNGEEATVTNCSFIGNTAGQGGGMHNNRGSPTVTNCTFSGNSGGSGGGMSNVSCSPTVTKCTFSGNSASLGGGMVCGSSSATVTNCRFIGNSASADGGGMYNNYSGATVTNCTFSGNSADRGGGMFNKKASPTVTNCTFSSNSASNPYGGGIFNYGYTDGAFPWVVNCILWGNTAAGWLTETDQIYDDPYSDTTIYYTCVEGWTGSLGGAGNHGDDPLLVDADGADDIVGTEDDNLRLSAGSACIDAGYNGAVPADSPDLDNDGNTTEPIPWDLDGRARFVDGDYNDTIIVDMGAYEYGSTAIIEVEVDMDELWMYQSLPGQGNSDLTAGVSVTDDPMGNTTYSYAWEIVLPGDVNLAPVTVAGGGAGDAYCTFAARGCDEPGGLSDSGQTFTVRVTVTGDDYGNTGQAEVEFGIALLGDTNNDGVVNVADRSITNAFWRTGSAGAYTLRDCDLNCDGVVNVADRSIANAIWRGILGQNSVSSPCPLR
ncbi:MAG: right-handed parallel beta-helix repeat-containing protein [Planctomycetota bacterium]|nr:MAG: right-handed parallel beta-helix repeat-containing protein [Planctomycetota bacterium]